MKGFSRVEGCGTAMAGSRVGNGRGGPDTCLLKDVFFIKESLLLLPGSLLTFVVKEFEAIGGLGPNCCGVTEMETLLRVFPLRVLFDLERC